jgi:glucose-6-phosphate 1-epimerase
MNTTLPAGMKLEKDSHGLDRLIIQTDKADAVIYRHGAHLAEWTPKGHKPVLWMSAKSNFAHDKPIRGGVPICFPWFGPNAADPKLPMHGFARTSPWQVTHASVSGGEAVVRLQLDTDLHTRALWPHDFSAVIEFRIGASLSMSLKVTNHGKTPFTFEEALHTYFTVGDVKQVKVTGLSGVTYIDKTDNFARKTQNGDITITAETDRVYLGTAGTVVLDDPSLKRKITVAKEGSNPWIAKAKAMADFGDEEWPGMICIETVNAADHTVSLSPGASHTMTAKISVG